MTLDIGRQILAQVISIFSDVSQSSVFSVNYEGKPFVYKFVQSMKAVILEKSNKRLKLETKKLNELRCTASNDLLHHLPEVVSRSHRGLLMEPVGIGL